jgi:hypothetical protein
MIGVIILFFYGILLGMIAGLLIAHKIMKTKITEVNLQCKDLCDSTNREWREYHQKELDNWQINSAALIEQAAYDAIIERDKQWNKKINGDKKIVKPKPSN